GDYLAAGGAIMPTTCGDVSRPPTGAIARPLTRKASAPSGAIELLMSPKPKLMAAARMLAGDETYRVRPPTVLEVFDRLIRSRRTARARTITVLSPAELADIFQADQALPSLWLPLLKAALVKEL
ncbi:hypothetical protein, partial [Streptomyces coelicoflavus]